jgi:hypothetical protein
VRAAAWLVIAIGIWGCLLPARLFSVNVSGDGIVNDLPVTVEDRTDLVRAVGPALPGQFNLENGVRVGADPSQLVVTWLGGTCDYRTHLLFERLEDGYLVSERTDSATSCNAAGFVRTVTMELSAPVDADTVRFVQR